MRIFENAAKHPIITIAALVGLNVLAVLILVFVIPVGRILNGEQIASDSSPDFVPERYDHSQNAEGAKAELDKTLEGSGKDNLSADVVHLYDKIGDASLSESEYKGAVENYNKALALRTKLKLSDDDEKARTLIGLAAAQQSLYQYDEAIAAAQNALNIRTKLFGRYNILTFVAWMRLAEVYRSAGRTNDCENAYDQSSEIATHLREWAQLRSVKHAGADYLESIDQLDKAELLAKDALAISEREFNDDDNGKLRALNSLAEIYVRQKKNAKAEETFAKALALVDKVQVENAVDAIDAYCIYLWETNRQDEAKKKLQEYCGALEKRYQNDPSTLCPAIASLHSRLYGYTQTEMGLIAAEKNLELCKKHYGDRSDETIRAMGRLATAYAKLKPDKFKETIEAAIKLADDNLSQKAWAREDLHERYADELAMQEDYDGAEREYALAYKEIESNDHESATRILAARASMLESLEKHREAADVYRTAISESAKSDYPDSSTYMFSLAMIEMDSFKNYQQAASLLEKSIQMSEQNLGQGHSIEVVRALVECYEKLGKKKEIEDINKKMILTYLEALDADEKKYGVGSERVVNSLEYCGDAYFTGGDFRQAEHYYARSAELNEKCASDKSTKIQHRNNCKLLMAMCQARLGKNEEAIKNFHDAFAYFDANKSENLATEKVVALQSYAEVLKKLHRTSEAALIEKKIAAES